MTITLITGGGALDVSSEEEAAEVLAQNYLTTRDRVFAAHMTPSQMERIVTIARDRVLSAQET